MKAKTAAPTAAARYVLAVLAGIGKGQRYRLPATGCWIGRSRGNILFPEDVCVSAHHATLTLRDGLLWIRDEGSTSGVFVSIAGQETLARDAFFSAGARLFRYLGPLKAPESPPLHQPRVYGYPFPKAPPSHSVEEVLIGGRPGKAVVSAGPLIAIGQRGCDLSFPQDKDLAGRHCELSPIPEGAVLRDLSGTLGTFVRIAPRAERSLSPGARFRIGQQVLQIEASA